MAKYYLYTLFSVFILLNGVDFFEKSLKSTIKKQALLEYKIEKQKLYEGNKEEVEEILLEQKKVFMKNSKLFFTKEKKETIVFSEIQSYIQLIAKSVDARIIQLQSGSVVETKMYRKYPISVNLKLIPEDINLFLRMLYEGDKYLFIDSVYVVAIPRERVLRIQITLAGYQIK